ncbi:MAG: cell division initiation protein [Thermobacillus sp. ZCTH02-B1]|uniref:cell division protein FtsL n=1 Tax=Thermobacillus sp. ZCTH02-B1 TaxID=1858795 RepID=UPI000B559E4C|nr:septum formation initiator family protein [Thermobacillus sp. ZCTH02-B1]OUM95935.1 MAG: cell division initiation protein [Thermobacillus sp. ZCTH02-B1]
MAIMHGNLAMKPNKRPEREPEIQEVRRKIIRRKPLPVQEKLLYLFTVVVCVMAASVILFRYAEIYRMNLEIRELTQRYEQLNLQIKELERKVETLSDPGEITEKAIELGMVYPEFDDVITLEVVGSSERTAMTDAR